MASNLSTPWVIATRESRLALWQAEYVRELLRRHSPRGVELLGMTTRGDQILDRSLAKVGGKGLFVKELEIALEEGRADLAVHSLKDVPMELPAGFTLACVLSREDARDAFVSNQYAELSALPLGARVGTSSLRRIVQLQALRPDLRIEPLRGNLDTRLGKLDAGHYDAIVLAAAGLSRLGLDARIRARFPVELMLPAAGQGALGLEIRSHRDDENALGAVLGMLNDAQAAWACAAERAVSRALGGSCSMPLAAYAVWDRDQLFLRAAIGDPQGIKPLVRVEQRGIVGDEAQAFTLGVVVAQQLREQGGQAILDTLA